jgi:hypothetical protein
MAWIKRNLYFAIGSLIAIILMGAGGYLLYQQMSDENKVSEDITSLYAEWDTLNNQPINPGMSGEGKTDNVKAAQEQRASLRAYVEKIRPYFKPIAPIPDIPTNKMSNADIATQLRNTIVQLQRAAEQQSVLLPHDYYFTFEAQRKLMIFDPASHDKIATHLGEIKAICDILFDAKINSLEFLRRELVSTNDDLNAPDYLPPDQKTTSTPLADLTPYRVTFQCFSAELASVLANLAASPYGLIVKNINVEPASPTAAGSAAAGGYVPGTSGFVPGGPGFAPNPGGFGGPPHGGMPNQFAPNPNYPQPGLAPAAAPARPGGPTVFLNEKPLRVSLLIEVVKPKPMK